MYPNQPGNTFDMEYYCNTHMPMAQRLLGATGFSVDAGLAGGTPGAPAPYIAIGYLLFDSLDVFQRNAAINGAELMADIPNYTNVSPVLQISEVKV
jgi:uncharacterized protein (TIGR02118 family)